MNARQLRAEAVAGIDRALSSVSADSIEALTRQIGGAQRIFFTGAGRSFLMIKSFAMALMQIGHQVYATGDISTPSIAAGDLLIVASSSGETHSVLLFVQQAQKAGARIAVITSNPNSSMARAATLVVEMGSGVGQTEGQPRWQTGSFFELALGPLGDCIVEQLATHSGASRDTVARNHANME